MHQTSSLLTPAGSYNRAAIMFHAWQAKRAVGLLGGPIGRFISVAWRRARVERANFVQAVEARARYATIEAARDAEAAALAANFGHDADQLRFERERLFWGRSIVRARRLPVYERALSLTLARASHREAA